MIAQQAKIAVRRICLSLLFVLGSFSLCEAQGVFDAADFAGADFSRATIIQQNTKALTLTDWQPSYKAMDAEAVSKLSAVEAPGASLSGPGSIIAPQITPEPSTVALLLAGSAAMLQFGRRKRSS